MTYNNRASALDDKGDLDGAIVDCKHLRNHYTVELVTVAGCVVTEDLINRTRGYNETALPIIEARYGNGVLERACTGCRRVGANAPSQVACFIASA